MRCITDVDCDDDTLLCDSGSCVECLGDADCDADPSEPICMGGNCTACTNDTQCMARNPDLPVCEGGSCVACTADKRGACGTFVCDGSTNTCSTTRAESSRGLCQDCIADVRPYRGTELAESVDGTAASVCTLRQTTCNALNQFDIAGCGAPFVSDSECGVADLDDGLCRMVDAVTNRCTIPCGTDDDCRPGITCNTGATVPYCNF